MKHLRRIIASFVVIVTIISVVIPPAHASNFLDRIYASVSDWVAGFSGENTGVWNPVDPFMGVFSANIPQKYYTTPTSSEEDKYGNVINYYRGGDTTTTKIIDSYNRTFNTIHNTTNNTNNYSANVKLSDFLNTYTTVNNDYTYNTQFKSWYYDNTTTNYNYSENNLYYNEDNSQYYISIDNSTDEYYLIDVQYSPTFVTVNYNYYNTNNTTNNVGDVTNVYYFELTDGRNSSTLTASEVAGLDLGYDVTNYVLVPDDPNTLSLQHFDGNYEDSSAYERNFHSVNRSVNYVDAGAFGKAVQLGSTSEAGIVIPGLADLERFSVEFRAYHNLTASTLPPFELHVGGLNLHESLCYGTYSYSVFNDFSANAWLTGNCQSDGTACAVCRNAIAQGYTKTLTGYSYSKRSATYDKSVPLSTVQSDAGFDSWQKILDSAPSAERLRGYGCFLDTSSATFSSGTYGVKENTCAINSTNKQIRLSYLGCYYRSGIVANSANYCSFANWGTRNQWNSFKYVFTPGKIEQYVNGDLAYSYNVTWEDSVSGDSIYLKPGGTLYLDELRVTTGDLVSTGAYTPSSEPYDTNMVLALPDTMTANTIYVRHSIPVSSYRIGGVRPSNPSTGFFYLPLHGDYTGGQSQLYDGSNWLDVVAMVYDGTAIKDVVGYQFSPVGNSPDVDTDLQPGRPVQPGEDVDQSTCTHTWEVTGGVKSTCTLNGTVEYTCSKCKATKSESIPKLGHTWEVKTSIQTTYDEQGNVVTQGYTIYRCTVCGEEFKDTEGTGPPQSNPSTDEGGEKQGFLGWLGSKVGELFGAIGDGVIGLLKSALGKVLDGLISLVNMVFDKLKTIVDLFGGFGDALGVLWTWLPPEIVTVLVAAVTVFVFIALLKLFMK